MQITITNKRATGGLSVQAIDGKQVAPGEQHVMTGRSTSELIHEMTYIMDDDVSVIGQMDAVDRAIIICDMKNIADPAADASTSAGEGFDLKDQAGADANVAPQMYFGAFDDAACKIPAANATLNTASAGTINSGAGTHLLKVTPASDGEFACTLTDAEDEVVYLKAWPVGTSYVIDCSDITSAEFTAS